MLAYVLSQWNHVDPVVMTGWFVSFVAEVIGIVYVVAGYIFRRTITTWNRSSKATMAECETNNPGDTLADAPSAGACLIS